MIRVAMLSKWHVHAAGYAKQFSENPNASVVAVWDTDIARGSEWANELGCEFIADLDALLAKEDIDAVCVCTETSIHPEIIMKCANAKKHIFTEKVLAIDPADAEALAEAIKASGKEFLISYRRLTAGDIRYMTKLVDDGAIGKLTHLRVRDAHNGASADWLPASFYDLPTCGGGAMIDLGAHPMYLSLYFMGEPETVSSVFTESWGKGVDDNCVSVLQYADGGIAVSETGFVSNSTFSLELNGTLGTLLLSSTMNGSIILSNKEGVRIITKEEIPAGLPLPVDLFVDCLVTGTPSPFTADDGIKLTKLMNAAYRSADLKETVLY